MADGRTRAQRREASDARILAAAREEFGAHGQRRATVRSIAARAGVDPSLVLQRYGTKDALFALAVRPTSPSGPDEVPQHLADVLDVRLRELDPATRALARSMLTSEEAAAVMRAHLQDRVDGLARASDHQDADVRAAVVVASILGVVVARHLLELPALRDADPERVHEVMAGWLAGLLA